ncbi:19832_t:CDS:2, partial [Gigaspora margarita]
RMESVEKNKKTKGELEGLFAVTSYHILGLLIYYQALILYLLLNSIEIDSDETGDNIDASSELLETNNDARKKISKANLKSAAKKQTIKEIGSDNNEFGDNNDAEFFLSKLPETDDNASTELSVPITQPKRAIEKLSDISNQLLTQA